MSDDLLGLLLILFPVFLLGIAAGAVLFNWFHVCAL